MSSAYMFSQVMYKGGKLWSVDWRHVKLSCEGFPHLLRLLLLHMDDETMWLYGATPGSLQPQECSGRCAGRCSATAYKKPCMFFCQKCCAKCLCVPPGTYGNKQFCPCYNNWKTKRGGPKCP
ncbi:hypothetical protein C4D60_Mb08t22370 [Musa balbisiana]|uniref:Uncharacterized protein n=1 Tax=Musa balbisiana TaxID=52838 RepID=A0A4S8K5N0_MUSBA|nr:hypothetical protein C4D60_Mb08t22370 [Musa balbisiana]